MSHHTTETPTAAPRRQRGFTLIEIMVVITLIGLIATVVVPGVMNRLEEGRIRTTEAKMTALRSVLDQFRMANSKYPDTLQELMNPDRKNLGDAWVEDPGQLRDGWDQDFLYIKHSSRKMEIISYGADGMEGGDPDSPDADLSTDKSRMIGN